MDRLETGRLVLRAFTKDDLADLYAYAKNPLVGPSAGWKPHQDLEDSREVLQEFIRGGEVWAIEEKSSGRVIGSIGLHPDRRRNFAASRLLGYVLDSPYWDRGYMTEAVEAAMDYAFRTLNLEVLATDHYPFNRRSRRVIEKSGFRYEGTLRRAYTVYTGERYDVMSYSITREEYLLLRDPAPDTPRRLLLVIDMQNDFVTGALGSKEAQKILPRVAGRVADYMAGGDPYFFTMDSHREEDYGEDAAAEMRLIPPHCIRGTEGWELVPQLKAHAGDNVIEKPAFLSVALDSFLSAGDGTGLELELCGVCTDICVVSNALYLRAKFPKSTITVRANCCAGTSPENHRAALDVMKSCLITVK